MNLNYVALLLKIQKASLCEEMKKCMSSGSTKS